jgi:tetratricopeptide (TPR) repeat protein
MSGRYAVAQLDSIDELVDGRRSFRPVRHHLGITSFGVTTWTAPAAGDPIIQPHEDGDAKRDEELFLVLQGRAVFELGGERVDAPSGTFVFAPPGVERAASAVEPGTTILAVDGSPGEAYEPRGWELWAPLFPVYEAGRYAEVAERLRAEVEASPQYGLLFYNLACCESLTGETAQALDHLRRAIELAERFRGEARTDSDLDPIRDEPAFRELVDEAPESSSDSG